MQNVTKGVEKEDNSVARRATTNVKVSSTRYKYPNSKPKVEYSF